MAPVPQPATVRKKQYECKSCDNSFDEPDYRDDGAYVVICNHREWKADWVEICPVCGSEDIYTEEEE